MSNRHRENIDDTIQRMWGSNLEPYIELYVYFKKFLDQNFKRFSKEQKIAALLTESMLLRSMNRQTEAQPIVDKNKTAFNRIADPLFAHRWKRMRLIEEVRNGNNIDTTAVKKLIDEAVTQGWPTEQIRALFLLHLIEVTSGLFKKAIETAQQVRLLAIENKDKQFILETSWAVAHTYFHFGHKALALKECLKVEHLFNRDFSKPQFLSFYVLLGACYQSVKNYKKSVPLYKNILQYLHQNKIDNPAAYMAVVSNLAEGYFATGDLKESERSYLDIMRLAQKSNWPQYELNASVNLAEIYYSMGNWPKMKSAIAKADKIPLLNKVMHQEVKVFELKARYQKAIGNTQLALLNYEKFHQQFEKWKNIENDEALKSIELKQELQLEQLQREVMKKNLLIKEQEMQMLNSYLGQKDKLIKQFAEYFSELEESNIRRKEIFVKLREMVHNVKNVQQTEIGGYLTKYNEAHQKTAGKLIKKYPSITVKEADTAVMLMQGLNNKDIATLTLTTLRNIEKHRLNLRRKMNAPRSDDLIKTLQQALENK